MQSYFGRPPASETRQHLSTGTVPLGQLLGGNGVGCSAGVETADERRRTGRAAANVEGPTDKCAILVGVEYDGRRCLQGDAILEGLLTVSWNLQRS
jgi:hypothetical protein